MTRKALIRAEAARLTAAMEARGAEVFEADILQPAGALLDLYGEDIRARAFVTNDPLSGEMMLRPDFTLPLVQRHIADARDAARYTYAGEVFRKQEEDPNRATEYLQVGYEIFGGNPADADAEVFSTFQKVLAPLDLRAAIGDIGLLRAAVLGLMTSDVRKSALMRHLWRPVRFKALLARYSDPPRAIAEIDETKSAIGLRSPQEVEQRLERLRQDQATPPLATEEIALIDALLAVQGKAPDALLQLKGIAKTMTSVEGATDTLANRLEAMNTRGVAVELLDFEAGFGRTTLEYYDGFVFGFFADDHPDMPPLATGGRYDALTRALGSAAGVPAVGGVIRPGLTLDLRDAQS